MKMKWLAMLVVLLLVACNNPSTDSGGGDKPSNENKSGEHDHDGDDHDHDGDDHDHGDDHKDGDKESQKSDDDKKKDDNAFEGEKVGSNDQSEAGQQTPDEMDEPDTELTFAEEFNEIKAAFNKKQSEFRTMVRGMTPEERTDEIFEKHANEQAAFGDQAFELAKENLEDEAAMQACVWASSNGSKEVRDAATELVLENFIDSEDLAGFCVSTSRKMATESSEAILKKISEKSPHKKVQAAAKYGLIQMYKNAARFKEYAKTAPDLEVPEFITSFDPESINLEDMYQELVDNYGELSAGRGTYKELCERALFEIRYLSIGKVAPDIVAKDLDGEEFKLSDYRGKVVVLDFWGDW